MLQHEVLQSTFVAKLNEQKKRVRGFLGIDVFENVRMGYFSEQVDFLQEGIGGNH